MPQALPKKPLPKRRGVVTGLILCSEPDAAVAHYALEGLQNTILAAEYRLALPDPTQLEAKLARTRCLLEGRREANRSPEQ